MEEDSLDFTRGWMGATVSFLEIWESIKEEYPKAEDRVRNIDMFMTLCELRMNGATWEEIATVAELNDMPELAQEARKAVSEGQA
jgi:hypothetical protein